MSFPIGHPAHACIGCPHPGFPRPGPATRAEAQSSRMHGSDLSGETDLLHCLLDDCRLEIKRLREELGLVKPEILISGEGEMPTLAYPDDAGFDLYVEDDWTIGPERFVDIQCGISIQLPPGFWALIVQRSSTLRSRGLLVNQAVIDTGYTGPIFVGVRNLDAYHKLVKQGERIAQLIPMPAWAGRVALRKVEQLGASSRGERGFGSSGA